MKIFLFFLSFLFFPILSFAATISQDDGYYRTDTWYKHQINNSIQDFKTNSSELSQYEKDLAFFSLIKDYEKYVYAMNYYDIDGISNLKCTYYNNKYKSDTDLRFNKIPLEEYYNLGLTLSCTEGMSAFRINKKLLIEKYGKNISSILKNYLENSYEK